jgi:hypothetical protein
MSKSRRGPNPQLKGLHTMSQADKRNTTNPSRRALLAGAPAVALVAGTSASGIATAAEAGAADQLDFTAMLGRAEFVIECLRTRYITEGWHGRGLDEDAAARTLAYFRNRSAGGPDDVDEWMVAVNFIGDHGQSIDWVVLGDPGGLICKAAKHSERAALASPSSADPVFPAIEAHKAACAAQTAAIDTGDEDASTEACYAENDALYATLTCRPTTREGAIALLEHMSSTWEGDYTVLAWAFGDDDGPLQRAASELPGMIAETLRVLIGEERS